MVDGADVTIGYERTVVVPASPARAFGLLADMADLQDWNPAVRRSALVSGTALHVGATYRCTVTNGPMRVTAHPLLVAVAPDEQVVYEGRFGPAHSRDSISFHADDAGARLTFRNVTTLPPWTRPLRRPITWAFHRQADRAVAGAVERLSH